MRLVTIRTGDGRAGGGTRAGRVEGDSVVLLGARDLNELLEAADWRALAGEAGETIELDMTALAPVVPRPPKIICLGLNYMRHIREMGHDVPDHPTIFAKYTSSLIGPRDQIEMPLVSERMDWEVELAVVIGRPGRDIPVASALDHVAGYTIMNDISARDWQRRTTQFLQGKTFEHSTPVGPWLVTADELPAGGSGLAVRCEVDGVEMQSDTTAELIFPVAETIAYLSQIFTLVPGDLIATGTPDGVGAGRTPPVFLRPGQTVRTAIEGIGELVNVCSAAR
ncbi:MAG: Ureidoglycolate lyase [Acidimicrobiales bacterium]|nr:Ureidoglycolate lyase [Acidimicrobiales bacterium]